MDGNASKRVGFRNQAHTALARAKEHLAGSGPGSARYAALELRLALEAVAYDTAQGFASELPESTYETWQPSALVDALLEVTPEADKSVRISIREEGGAADAPWLELGQDRRTPRQLLGKHYHSLGSLLHVPTLAQVRKGKVFDEVKAVSKCKEVAAELEQVLASPVWGVNLRDLVNFLCLRCKKPVVRTMPADAEEVVAKCRECKAAHKVQKGDSVARGIGERVPCLRCKHEAFLFQDEIVPGTHWQCTNCQAKQKIVLAIAPAEEAAKSDGS